MASLEYGKKYLHLKWNLDPVPRLHNARMAHVIEDSIFDVLLKYKLVRSDVRLLPNPLLGIIISYYGVQTEDAIYTDAIYTEYLQIQRLIQLQKYIDILETCGLQRNMLNLVYIDESKNTRCEQVGNILKNNAKCLNTLLNIAIMQFHGMYSGLKTNVTSAHYLATLAFEAGCVQAPLFLSIIESSKLWRPNDETNLHPKFCKLYNYFNDTQQPFIHPACFSDPLYPLWRHSAFCVSHLLDSTRSSLQQMNDSLAYATKRAKEEQCVLSQILLANWYFAKSHDSLHSTGCCWGSRMQNYSPRQIEDMTTANKFLFAAAKQGSIIGQVHAVDALQNNVIPMYPMYNHEDYVELLDDCLVWLRRASDQGYDVNAERGSSAWRLLKSNSSRSNSKDAADLIKLCWC